MEVSALFSYLQNIYKKCKHLTKFAHFPLRSHMLLVVGIVVTSVISAILVGLLLGF